MVFIISCNFNQFDSSKISGRYKVQYESDLVEKNKSGWLGDLVTTTLNASAIEITYDGNGNGIDHIGNNILGFGARMLDVNIDEKNIYKNTFKYKIEGDVILVKYNKDKTYRRWAQIQSVNDDYSYIRLFPLYDNPDGEKMQLVKVTDDIIMN